MITREEAFGKAQALKAGRLKEKTAHYNMMLNAAYASNERLKEIDGQSAKIGAQLVTAALVSSKNVAELKAISKALSAEKNEILKKSGVEEISFDCPVCKDTGYVSGKICDCVKTLASKIVFEDLAQEMPIEVSRFEGFDLKYYKNTDLKEGNPKRRMTAILKTAKEYAEGFSPKTSKNLLFMGDSGLGKTHLTLAIVGAVTEKGFMPIYGSAENLFSTLEKEKFTGENRGAYDMMTSADLLVIDDLGAEMETKFSKSALYNLVNTRLLSGRPTIINTNLSMKEIESRYTARISSRLIGNFDAFRFLGEDIRQQKAIESKG